MKFHSAVVFCLIAIGIVSVGSENLRAAGPDGGPPGPAIDSHALPRVAPTPADQAAKTFQIHKGLRLERVASEPEVSSPVGISFDEDGRLYVVEMIGYPDRREAKMGRIKLLQSTHRDGHYDKATIFADNLPWPTSVFCYGGGVFVTASPDVLWLKDTNGDGVADERKVIFTGFGVTTNPLNVQALVNNLAWGLDNRIHGATSFNGGLVTGPNSDKPLNLHNRDFSFDPRTFELCAENGGGQHGLSFDAWGRKYVCMNSKAVETFFYDSRYASRNPLYAMPAALHDVAADGMNVYRISPDEAWRVLRTSWRVAGQVTGPVEGGGRASGYFTGVSGITIYTGTALPAEFQGNAFIGEVANNLVHREVISPDGVGVVAHRAADEKKSEFLASKDIWFRPVQLANGPDGALYIVDMYREVIEHPWSLPESIKGHLDLHSGSERGRIWRVVPDGYSAPTMPMVSKATTTQLVALLEHPNGWQRDTASRLLFERQDQAAVPLLAKLLTESKSPLGRLHALHMLDGLKALSVSHVLAALSDADAHVREHAILLSERFLRDASCPPALWARLQQMTADPAMNVRYQLAFSLGESRDPAKVDALAKIARRDAQDKWMQAAILSSLAGDEAKFFSLVSTAPEMINSAAGQEFLRELATLIGTRNGGAEIEPVIHAIDSQRSAGNAKLAFSLARSLREGLFRGGKAKASDSQFDALIAQATKTAADSKSDEATRVEAIRLLGTTPYAQSSATLLPLLDPSQPQAVQLAAVASLDRMSSPEIGPELVKRLGVFSPQVRSETVSTLLKRPDRAVALLHGIQSRAVPASTLTTSQSTFLRRHRDPAVRELAGKALTGSTPGREQVIRAFQPALELHGDSSRGKRVYESRCISCHRLGGEGFAVGPDLTTVRNAGKEKTLINILDPNREVAPNYIAYMAETRNGDSIVGIIANETATSLTLRQAFGKENTVLRSDLKRLESQKLSLMPEGLEEGLKPQDLADLLEYVMTAK